ncbi:hypothetical protein EDD86DRAFT_249263 [Gorgonomyces haynaldii]|nr:hypothetical protein EDD86DRAFT_249263 [Gorgonomyces haynaldii]
MILGLLLQVSAGSYTMEMPRYSTECFTERLKHGDRIEIGFEVVFNPDTSNLHTVTQERASAFGFYAEEEKEVADELQMLSNNFRFMKDEQKHLRS